MTLLHVLGNRTRELAFSSESAIQMVLILCRLSSSEAAVDRAFSHRTQHSYDVTNARTDPFQLYLLSNIESSQSEIAEE
jgi:hypothetical protein